MRRRKYRTSRFRGVKLKKRSFQSAIALMLIGIGGVLFVALFSSEGLALALKDYLIQIFGWASFFVPIFIILTALSLFDKLRLPFFSPNVSLGFGLTLISLMSLSQSLIDKSAGEFGALSWEVLSQIITPIGALLFYIVAFVLGIVIIFNTGLDSVLSAFVKSFILLFRGTGVVVNKIRNSDGKNFSGRVPNFAREPAKVPDRAAPVKLHPNPIPYNDKVWEYPPLSLLSDEIGGKANRGDLKQNASIIEKTLESFGLQAKVVEVNYGPAVTQYALEIALGTKLTKITALANDIAMALAAPTGTVRIEAPIPGKSLVGIEVPNITPEMVSLKRLLTSDEMQKSKSPLAIALGLDVSGKPMIADVARMPHMLMAGATGSGKSVAVNTIISSLLFRTTPNELKLLLVDPKIVELSGWNGIPHLLTPVITQPDKVLSALKWAVQEMERRYQLLAQVGVRNIDQYNEKSGFQSLPFIVIIIDELADLMMYAPVEVEESITRIAQMARAVGIHLVLATQRPSVDVITGLIKANIPTRIAFNVTSQIDSRVIIDQMGAEKLLGKGDMLYVPPDASKPMRIQGVFMAPKEVDNLIEFLKKEAEPQYTEEITTMPTGAISRGIGKTVGGNADGRDPLFMDAVNVIIADGRASSSILQRRLKVGYARAARIIDELYDAGVVGPPDGSKPREVLISDPSQLTGNQETSSQQGFEQ